MSISRVYFKGIPFPKWPSSAQNGPDPLRFVILCVKNVTLHLLSYVPYMGHKEASSKLPWGWEATRLILLVHGPDSQGDTKSAIPAGPLRGKRFRLVILRYLSGKNGGFSMAMLVLPEVWNQTEVLWLKFGWREAFHVVPSKLTKNRTRISNNKNKHIYFQEVPSNFLEFSW